MDRWNNIAAGILFCIGAAAAWSSATTLSMGSFRHPGAGFLPFGLACILSLLSLALFFSKGKATSQTAAFWPERAWVRPLLGSLTLFAYALFLGILGFLPTTILFMVGWTRVIERLPWHKVFLVATGVTAGLYLVFIWFLGVPIPLGFWKR